MLLDTTRFPLVFLREDGHHQHDAAAGVAALGALLDRGERFVLLTDHLPDHRHDESHEDRKQRTLFFKRNKERLRQFCAGMIVITGDRTLPAAVRLAAKSMGKVLALTFDFIADESDAVSAAGVLLATRRPFDSPSVGQEPDGPAADAALFEPTTATREAGA